ncbi:MAG: cytochrome c-type biogenesis protein CcmH [Actinomycetota bacterium]
MRAGGNGQGGVGAPQATGQRSVRRTALVLAAAVAVAAVALAVVATRGPSRPPTLQERVRVVAEDLRCPECQNLSVADSPSGLAREMRVEIARRLRLGQTASQIESFFVSRYGRWILLTPDAGGIGLFAWLAPALAVAAGGALAFTVVRRRRRATSPVDDETAVADPAESSDEPRLTGEERDRIQREIAQLEEVP